MTASEEATLAKHGVRLDNIEREIGQIRETCAAGFARLESRLDRQDYIRSELYHSEQAGQDKALLAIENTIAYQGRLLWGVLVLTIGSSLGSIAAVVGALQT